MYRLLIVVMDISRNVLFYMVQLGPGCSIIGNIKARSVKRLKLLYASYDEVVVSVA